MVTPREQRIRVFVHLAHGFGATQWQDRWDKGELIGINDRLPYGYFWAEQDGCDITHSEDLNETFAGKCARLGVRLLLGFDLVHAWRNRAGITRADIVWTHTESQSLGVLMLLIFRLSRRSPRVIAGCVWLFDEWPKFSLLKRALYRVLLRRADVLVVHSPENLQRARALLPGIRSELCLFGTRADQRRDRGRRGIHSPIRVLSLGNDRHRDWATLIRGVSCGNCHLRIVAPRVNARDLRRARNTEVVHPQNNAELFELYDWADFVVLALKPNLHASGITVIEEAVLRGVPVICSDTGGLKAYFRDGEVSYVPPRDPGALRQRIVELGGNDEARCSMVRRASIRIDAAELSSRGFALRHAALSHELLGTAGTKKRSPFLGSAARVGTLAITLAIALIGGAVAEPVEADRRPMIADRTIDLCEFKQTFSENFRPLSVSPWGKNGSRWIAHTPWHGDFGDAVFADPQPGFPFRVVNGVLYIEARKGKDGKWRSGLLASATPTTNGFAQQFGYFEMRAQLPAGPGVWPAFWLNTNEPAGSDEPGVEIDIMEYYGQFPQAFHSTVHVWYKGHGATKNRIKDNITSVPAGSLSAAFHTYGADVEPDWITFYLDRREFWRTHTPPELKKPLMIVIDLALGSGWPIDKTPSPSIMKVDYVQVYQRLPRNDTTMPLAAVCGEHLP